MSAPFPPALALAALLLLGGCLQSKPPAPPAPTTPATTTPAPATPTPATAALAAPAPASETPPNPAMVLGMAAADLRALLGPPAFRRQDRPAEIWQYAGGGCVLDVFLYAGEVGGGLSATHYEFRALAPKPVDPAACFAALLDARAGDKKG